MRAKTGKMKRIVFSFYCNRMLALGGRLGIFCNNFFFFFFLGGGGGGGIPSPPPLSPVSIPANNNKYYTLPIILQCNYVAAPISNTRIPHTPRLQHYRGFQVG